jgi:hypothetical protein
MKQTICVLCEEEHAHQDGEWVIFADYQAMQAHSSERPPGYEYFCKTHAPYAKCFSGMPAQQAVNLLKQNLSLYGLVSQPNKSKKWLSFISKLYQPK